MVLADVEARVKILLDSALTLFTEELPGRVPDRSTGKKPLWWSNLCLRIVRVKL